uniref:Uncharacterized protein n=1 Tax=Panagrolaimus sp. PS1159 TaxID=55785 RepID=A0AC35GMI6_9BILA
MAFYESKSQFGKSQASNFASSRINVPFRAPPQLQTSQLPFQSSGYPHQMVSPQIIMQQYIAPDCSNDGFNISRVPADPKPAATFQRDVHYCPNPSFYGYCNRKIDESKCAFIEKIIGDRLVFQLPQ